MHRALHASRILTSAILLLPSALATRARAQVTFDPPTPSLSPATPVPDAIAPATAPATTLPARGGLTTLPSAESVLEKLLQEKAAIPVPTPNTTTTTQPDTQAAAEPRIKLREGEQISNRAGHLVKNEKDGELQFVFDPPPATEPGQPVLPAYPPMGIIPSRRLWSMEEAALGSNPTFRIDAEVTQYRGKNYLYIQPDGISRPSTRPAGLVQQIPAVAPNEPAATHLREGQAIYSRVGRLSKDEKTGAMIFTFDSDGKQMYDPPMAVVPCRYLAVMEDASNGGTKPTKFRISAEVTQYRGKNFLYPKFVQTVRDLNQF